MKNTVKPLKWLHKYSDIDAAKNDAVDYYNGIWSNESEAEKHLDALAENHSFLMADIWFWPVAVGSLSAFISYALNENSPLSYIYVLFYYYLISILIKKGVNRYVVFKFDRLSDYHLKRIYVEHIGSIHGGLVGGAIAYLYSTNYLAVILSVIGGFLYGRIHKKLFPKLRVPYFG